MLKNLVLILDLFELILDYLFYILFRTNIPNIKDVEINI